MRVVTTALGLALAFAAAAQAQQQTPGTVEYYIMHTAERQAMDRQCALSVGRSHDCLAARKADYYVSLASAQQRAATSRFGEGSTYSPQFFVNNPIARMNMLRECAHPLPLANPYFQPTKGECQAAEAAR